MSRLTSWFAGPKANAVDLKAELATERGDLEQAMRATNLIINDDIDGAETELRKGNSTYHDLGTALVFFMKAILGFEKENISKAADLLAKCETRAWDDLKRAQKRAAAGHAAGEIYPPGTEYELVVTQTQLMSAVLGVLNESVIEAMKSFLKLRRAYITLDAIITKENEYFKKQRARKGSSSAAVASARASTEDKKVFSATQTPVSSSTSLEGLSADMEKLPASLNSTAPALQDIDIEMANPIDAFIHSGVNMCMGILMLMMSLMPPAFARVLSIVGFRGDREAGIRMLWRSVAHPNAVCMPRSGIDLMLIH